MAYKDKYQSSDTQVNKENNIYTTVQKHEAHKGCIYLIKNRNIVKYYYNLK